MNQENNNWNNSNNNSTGSSGNPYYQPPNTDPNNGPVPPPYGSNFNSSGNDKVNDFVNKAQDEFHKFNDTEDTTIEYSSQDVENNKLMAVLSYIGFLWVIPYIARRNESPYVRFHLNQGLPLLIGYVIMSVFGFILPSLMGVFGRTFMWIIRTALMIFTVLGVFNAASGKAKKLPVIGDLNLMK